MHDPLSARPSKYRFAVDPQHLLDFDSFLKNDDHGEAFSLRQKNQNDQTHIKF